jgi:hypothetical protein
MSAPTTTLIDRDFKLLMSHPFCLGEGPAPVQREQRRDQVDAFVTELGNLGHSWFAFDVDGILPAIFKKRKDVLLVATPVNTPELMAAAVKANQKYEATRTVVSVSHSAYLWDYGCGAVDVIVTFRLKNEQGLLHFYETAEEFEEICFEENLYFPPGFKGRNWGEVQNVFSRVLRHTGYISLSWLKRVDEEEFKTETCTWSLSLVQAEENGNNSIAISGDVMEKAFVAFCGSDLTPTVFRTGVREIPAAHVGYSGNMALVDSRENEIRVHWLWKVVALLYGVLLESVEPMYGVVVDLIDDGKSRTSPAQIRRIRMLLDLLHNEADPVTICSESFDQLIYENVWITWGGISMDKMVDDRADFLADALTDIAAQESQALQGRLNFVVFVLTLVSVASTVAAVIQLIDYSNSNLESQTRAIVLGIITGFVGALCAVIVTVDVGYYFNMMSRCKKQCMGRYGMGGNGSRGSGSKRNLISSRNIGDGGGGGDGKLAVKVDT